MHCSFTGFPSSNLNSNTCCDFGQVIHYTSLRQSCDICNMGTIVSASYVRFSGANRRKELRRVPGPLKGLNKC